MRGGKCQMERIGFWVAGYWVPVREGDSAQYSGQNPIPNNPVSSAARTASKLTCHL